jgi:hypothetical protein
LPRHLCLLALSPSVARIVRKNRSKRTTYSASLCRGQQVQCDWRRTAPQRVDERRLRGRQRRPCLPRRRHEQPSPRQSRRRRGLDESDSRLQIGLFGDPLGFLARLGGSGDGLNGNMDRFVDFIGGCWNKHRTHDTLRSMLTTPLRRNFRRSRSTPSFIFRHRSNSVKICLFGHPFQVPFGHAWLSEVDRAGHPRQMVRVRVRLPSLNVAFGPAWTAICSLRLITTKLAPPSDWLRAICRHFRACRL